jgi:hypothetical protein
MAGYKKAPFVVPAHPNANPPMNTEAIAEVPFVDGTTRPVYVDAWGQQFVHDDEGKPVFGLWVKPSGEEEDPLGPDVVAGTPADGS